MNKLFDVIEIPLFHIWDIDEETKEEFKKQNGYYEPTDKEYFDALVKCYHRFKDIKLPGIPVYLSPSGSPEDFENNVDNLVGYWDFGKLILNGNIILRKFVKENRFNLTIGYRGHCEDIDEEGNLVGFKIISLAILTIDGVPVDQRPELFQN
jgi:hypothetical protein